MPTLTRQEIYDLVWSTPMTKAAESFGISDVGLAKICDRHRVPTPQRGYWAKKEAGKKVKQTIFVKVDDPLLDRIVINPSHDSIPEPVREVIEKRRAERKASRPVQLKAILTPSTIEPVTEPHPAIRATALVLRRAQALKSGVAEAIGPGLCGISIGVKSVERIIFILDRLARACDGHAISLVAKNDRMAAVVGSDEATFVINEKRKQIEHVLTEAEIAAEAKHRKRNERIGRNRFDWDNDYFIAVPPKFDIIRTGELGLQIYGWGEGLRRNWKDGKTQTLETMIDKIVTGLEAYIVTLKLRREADERAEAEQNELERRRGLSKARRERESQRKRLIHKIIRTEREVAQLREWISTYGKGVTSTNDADLIRMVDWAQERLAALQENLNPFNLSEQLRTRKLFPEVDELDDPLGEPPPERQWY